MATTADANPKDEALVQSFTMPWLLLLLGVPLSYAILRYHICGGVDWAHFPLYIANKALSLAAVLFVATSYLIGKTIRAYDADPPKRLILIKLCGLMGFSLASVHALMALLLVSPAYYPAFFAATGKMNLTGELSVVFGVLSMWCLAVTALTSLPFMFDAIGAERWQRGQWMGYFSLALAAGHVLVMGFAGWMTPADWHAALPPISLIAFIAATVPVLIKLIHVISRRPA
jgi:hypothetical protein